MKTSTIEGEILDPARVRSPIAWHVGIGDSGVATGDHHIEGIVHVTLDSTQHYGQILTGERLFGWYAALFPTFRGGGRPIPPGAWRIHPVQVISGAIFQERVHFEGLQPSLVLGEMASFLEWLNIPAETSRVLRAALPHLRFFTVHPFVDANGRITRAIADMCLAYSGNTPQRYYGSPPTSTRNAPSSIGCWSRPRGPAPISLSGCRGSWNAWNAPSAAPMHPLTLS